MLHGMAESSLRRRLLPEFDAGKPFMRAGKKAPPSRRPQSAPPVAKKKKGVGASPPFGRRPGFPLQFLVRFAPCGISAAIPCA
jgi:hypothetical protein